MARINRLSDRAIKAKALSRRLHPDGRRLHLQVSASGGRGWVFRFKRAGLARDMELGVGSAA